MSSVVFSAALSHSPLMNFPAPQEERPAIDRFRTGVEELARRLHASRPDVVVLIGPDHFRAQFYENMPAFTIAVRELDGWGDWNTPTGPFVVHQQLAQHLLQFLLDDGFDPAQSHRMRVDHGITQPLELLGLLHVPVVAVVLNAAAPPLPTPQRAHALGRAIANAISTFPGDVRVAILGSGGLSHAPPSVSVHSTNPVDAVRVERMISGRDFVLADRGAREGALLADVGRYASGINPEWDRVVLEDFKYGRGRDLANTLSEAAIERDGGNGGQEVRTWLAAVAAGGDQPMEILAYEAIPFFITGMGIIAVDARR